MKKTFAVLLIFVLMVSAFPLTVRARAVSNRPETIDYLDEKQPFVLYSNYTKTTTASLSISSGEATCYGSITGYAGTTTKVTIELTLQRKVGLIWWKCDSGTKTINDYRGSYEFKCDAAAGTKGCV